MALFDAFLKIDGITGEHKGEIQLESFSWGVTNTVSRATGGQGTGRPMLQDFSFTSRLGQQSPQLFLHAVQGIPVQKAELLIHESHRHITVSFFDVFISSYKEDMTHTATVEGDTTPLEMVSLNFSQVQIAVDGGIK